MTLPLAKKDSILTLDFLNEADYVKITLDWLSRCGISIEYNPNMLEYHIKGNQEYHSFNRVIPADFSTAAFPLAAGLIAGNQLKIANLDFDDLQGDKKVFEYAQQMNGNIQFNNQDVVVAKSDLVGGVFDLNRTPDALPIMAVLGCYAQGTTILSNVPQARFKECDRIACMTKELRKMGANIEELPDGLVIHGGKILHGAQVESYNDHRIAMALSVAALGANGPTYIKDGQCCKVTYPAFVEDFQSIGVSMKESSIK
jgi:3-phosphoshikimate 1-carboxyvinyltransferase